MAAKFRVLEFVDHKSLAAFMDAAGEAVTRIITITMSSSASFVLFCYVESDELINADISDFTHQGPGRGFSYTPSVESIIPDNYVKHVDIKTGEVVPIDGFQPARVENGVVIPPTTTEALERSRKQAERDQKIAEAQAALDALRDAPL